MQEAKDEEGKKKSNKQKKKELSLPSFLFPTKLPFDPDNPHRGFMKGELQHKVRLRTMLPLVLIDHVYLQSYRAVLTGPSSVKKKAGTQ